MKSASKLGPLSITARFKVSQPMKVTIRRCASFSDVLKEKRPKVSVVAPSYVPSTTTFAPVTRSPFVVETVPKIVVCACKAKAEKVESKAAISIFFILNTFLKSLPLFDGTKMRPLSIVGKKE